MTRLDLYNEKRLLTFGVWAALKKRIDGEVFTYEPTEKTSGGYLSPAFEEYQRLEYEIAARRREFAAEGRVLTGCGGSISIDSESDLALADTKSVRDSIFGKTSSKEDDDCEYTSKSCPLCHKKNVRTVAKTIRVGNLKKRHVSGSCGCSKVY